MTYNTIVLKDHLHVREEYVATAAAITPGHLVEITSGGLVRKHATVDGNVLPMFALEDALQGNGIDTAYANSVPVQCWIPTRGDIVNAILLDGESVVPGDFLTSAGAGELKKLDVVASGLVIENPAIVVGVAVTTLDLGSSSTTLVSKARIQVRIL